MAVPPRLLLAYRRTRYAVDDVGVRIGRGSRAMDAWLARHDARVGVFVTAWNPRSRRMPAGWNARMQHRLRERLRRGACFAAAGAGRCWREEHLLVLAAPAWVIRLAARFRQLGVVVVRTGHPARLVMLG
jgi:hypothetical protein